MSVIECSLGEIWPHAAAYAKTIQSSQPRIRRDMAAKGIYRSQGWKG